MKKIKIAILSFLVMIASVTGAKAQSSNLSNAVNAVIDNYLALKNALVNADGNAAEDKAKGLLAAISAVPVKEMNPKQLATWNTLEPKLEFDSRHISEVARVPHQREHFASLSNNMYTVVKTFKLNKTVLYRQYCLMGKQYFLSDSQTGKDPYMAMEHCARVVETLPAAK